MAETRLVLHVGSNNWQRQGEYGSGSGILHCNLHHTFNSLPDVKCYSIYPSQKQTDPENDDTFRIFHIDHDVPICESSSPVSTYRWHQMDEDQFAAYVKRWEDVIYAFMDEVEEKEGRAIDCLISHHAFINPMVSAAICDRRRQEGKATPKHFCFVHGTALKMYLKEEGGSIGYPMRFLPRTQAHGVFNSTEKCAGIWANSMDCIRKFVHCFPDYPVDRIVYSQPGVDTNVFYPRGTTVNQLAGHFREGDRGAMAGVKRLVTFCGHFVERKRLDVVLRAASAYERALPDVGTAIIGSGPPRTVEEYASLAECLGLARTFFVGEKPQDTVAEFFSASEVGMLPSREEPFGMCLVECMACGCPVIGAKSGGPKDFVKEEQGGLIEEDDAWETEAGAKRLGKRLAEVVMRALAEDWKGKAKGPSCVAYVAKGFTSRAQCLEMLDDMAAW